MDKKYFFFDIDGTLTDPATTKIVPSAKQALQELIANGHFVAISTGRAHFFARPVMEELGLVNMVCYGGMGLVINNKLVKCKALPIELMRKLFNECDKKNVPYYLQLTDEDIHYTKTKELQIPKLPKFKNTKVIYDENLDVNKIDTILKGYVFIDEENENKIETLKEVGKLRIKPEFLIIQYDEKKQGIIDMMNYLHADIKDVVVFGDDTNDLVMFDKTWTSIAMGNGVDALKQKADYVTDTSVNDGVYKACKKFGWI